MGLTDADKERLDKIKIASVTGFYTDRNADRDIAVLLHIIETQESRNKDKQ